MEIMNKQAADTGSDLTFEELSITLRLNSSYIFIGSLLILEYLRCPTKKNLVVISVNSYNTSSKL